MRTTTVRTSLCNVLVGGDIQSSVLTSLRVEITNAILLFMTSISSGIGFHFWSTTRCCATCFNCSIPLSITMGWRLRFIHFTDKDIKAPRGQVTRSVTKMVRDRVGPPSSLPVSRVFLLAERIWLLDEHPLGTMAMGHFGRRAGSLILLASPFIEGDRGVLRAKKKKTLLVSISLI